MLGWFYGFNLHLIINDKGEILDFILTTRNVNDRELLRSMDLHKRIFWKLFGDKDYIGKDLFEQLFIDGVHSYHQNKKEHEKFFDAYARQNYCLEKEH